MDGGAIALDTTGTYAVWRRDTTIFASTTAAGASVSGPEQTLGSGRDPVVARNGRSVDVAWTGEAGIALRQAGKPVAVLGPGRFASLLALPGHTLVAAEYQGRISVRNVPR